MVLEILLWIAFGAFVGWIASMIMKTNEQQGAVGNIITGILGAVLGGFLWRGITGESADSIVGQLLLAIIGAMIVIAVWRSLSRYKDEPVEHK